MTLTAKGGDGSVYAVNGGTASVAAAVYTDSPRIPNDVRVRGVNIAPLFSWIDTPDQDSVWSAMWRVWDWNGTIKPQVDDAATIGNCVRMFGNTHAVTAGNITLATYLARWEQFLNYCARKGLYVYPCGGSLGDWGADTTYTAAATIYAAWADLLAGYSNIIGVDIINEAWYTAQLVSATSYKTHQSEPYLHLVHHLGGVVRRRAHVPVACSVHVNTSQPWGYPGDSEGGPIFPLFTMSDFIDIHIYMNSTPDDVAALMLQGFCRNKQLIVGEFGGLDTSQSTAVRAARYTDVADIISADADYCGALAWTCWDLNNTDSRSGLFDGSRELRTDISTPFATLPTSRLEPIYVADYGTPQLAADAATGKRLVFPANQTYITTGITIPANCYVEGNGSTLKFGDNTTATTDQSDALLTVNGSGVTVDGLNFDANSPNQGATWSQYRHCLSIYGAFDDVTVTNCDMVNLIGDGVYVNTQTHGNIKVGPSNTFTANYDARNGVAVVTGDTVEVFSNTFTTVTKSAMPGPIDIEPNDDTDHLAHVDIHDNTIVGGSTAGTGTLPGIVYGGFMNAAATDITIRDNDISGTRLTAGVVVIGVNGGPFNAAIGIVVDGNTIHDIGTTGKIGVELDYWIGADVTGNTLDGMETGIAPWYACLGSTTGNVFTGGVVTNIATDPAPHCS